MLGWKMTGQKKREPEQVTSGRFEIEQSGEVAYLEYTLTDHVLGLIHSEVPDKLRGLGLAASLAQTALQWARDNNRKVDVVCPLVLDYIAKHPEYSDLVLR
jgi:predicted GNAT family acetyltransferase